MKKIKCFYMGKRLKDIYPHATRFQVFKFKLRRFLEKVALISFTVGVVAGSFHLGSIMNPVVKVEAQVQEKTIPEVMKRIAICESGGKHFENGQVLTRGNKNKTTDVGKYQINSIHFKEATKLGFDVFSEQGNEDYAMWIYENRGTEPWVYSKKCWQKYNQ
jgi:uncharacterized protein YqfB (UPF0267 family)